eukprot:CAMPEP_0184368742 /NCGR_PEP_ID=MMETSP1089-20130417/161842_1 /TAXON_ID=38269 ORGANISM="Gloeochaete wittrockiana, Strain SAG46.84" /NCGR_SAMPLE_ID=MMETSP1089 /ASSEMBLY_ACC=CAM_ASM_000445 /LENGTH=131 /DNA_ID=CAMNT_0026711077 /DNA_START=738 /DNA_END=1133 /DNA_ORIENTATION=+
MKESSFLGSRAFVELNEVLLFNGDFGTSLRWGLTALSTKGSTNDTSFSSPSNSCNGWIPLGEKRTDFAEEKGESVATTRWAPTRSSWGDDVVVMLDARARRREVLRTEPSNGMEGGRMELSLEDWAVSGKK